jgi:hypothetical protein
MQIRGVPPNVVEHAIRSGRQAPGRTSNEVAHIDATNSVTVITDRSSGRVVTVITGDITKVEKMAPAISANDRERCVKIGTLIERYKTGRIEIEQLIRQLEPLCMGLESGSTEWRQSIRWK